MNSTIAVIGLQIGDEGKAAVLDFYADKLAQKIGPEQIGVERYQGAANAGHTVRVGGKVYKFHTVPSGIVTPQVYNLVGKGMLVNPRKLMAEISELRSQGIEVSQENLGVASNAHVILDYHVDADQSSFNKPEHTSTGNGVKQTAAAKYARTGIRMIEFLDPVLMVEILRERIFSTQWFPNHALESFVESYNAEREFLEPFITLETKVRKSRPQWLEEGAQGVMLDVDDGLYPGITSSHPSNPFYRPDTLLGVVKLYKSSVGNGDRAFISRFERDLENRLVEEWEEIGTTTGRPRALGWFDAVEARYAVECTNPDYLVGTHGDSLETFYNQEKIKIVVGYKVNGREYTEWDPSFHRRDTLWGATPIYEEFETWERFSEGGRLTSNAQRYIDRIQELLGKEFAMIKTGPERNEAIIYKEII